MIISHTHRFVFIKSIKTAGTSVEAALSQYCEGDDIVTPLNNYQFNRDDSSKTVHRAMNAERLPWWNSEIGQHVDAATLMERLPQEVWKNYLKISIARNPWDRLVSLFMWRNKGDPSLRPKRRFYHRLGVPLDEVGHLRKRFVCYARGDWETNDKFYFIKRDLCVDFVIRYEDLMGGLRELCGQLGVDMVDLPRLKTGIRPGGYHYSEYYNNESREIVSERHYDDIREFGYTFEQA